MDVSASGSSGDVTKSQTDSSSCAGSLKDSWAPYLHALTPATEVSTAYARRQPPSLDAGNFR